MASQAWHSDVSAIDRYGMIQEISSSSTTEAVAAEQKAFMESASKAEYEQACEAAARALGNRGLSQPSKDADADETQSGIRVGTYDNCRFIAEGVTSEVYRSGTTALKVIVAHQNLEPHNPLREIKILQRLQPPCISLQETFRDQEQRLVMAFPFMPHTLASILDSGSMNHEQIKSIFRDVLTALRDIHRQGIIHRDVKPSAVLLKSPEGPAYLSDFGTAWSPDLSSLSEPSDDKMLALGTGPYRAPEVLFGNKSYSTSIDMWALGVMLAESASNPPTPIFESRAAHEDGNQLGLILSIFKTLGTPNRETWPEAEGFKVNPFELWTVFPQRSWTEILPGVDPKLRDMVATLIRFDGKRATADEALAALALT